MTGGEIGLLRLGIAAARAVFKLWSKDAKLAGAVGEEFVTIAVEQLTSEYDRRRMQRQVDRMADEIALRLEQLLAVEFTGLDDGERSAAVFAVSTTLEVARLGPALILDNDLDPEALEAALRAADRNATRDLNQAAAAFYDFLLREVSNYIVELATTLPSFERQAWSEILKREAEILALVHTVLERLPAAQAAQAASQDAVFADRYSRAVARRLDKLELFGVTLASPQARYSLSVAYISLTASLTAKPVEGEEDEGPEQVKVEQAVEPHRRLLIRGEAGSGKTTLLQWLAVKSARREFDDELAELNALVPFLIRLRRWVDSPLPTLDDLIKEVAASIASAMPSGWVQRVMDEGRALVLIDGLDELPEHERNTARDWLADLCDEFPQCRFIATSRPAAVSETFLDELGFVASELQPMALPDMNRFVDHWHKAAAKQDLSSSEELELSEMAVGLKDLLRTRPPLRNLGSTPLLLALICALNRDRRTNLPRDRNELYRIALEMLLVRRDVERSIDAAAISLSFPQITALLERFAFWLMFNEQSDARVEDFEDLLVRELKSMPSVEAPVADVRRQLLIRSGLLREPIEGRVDFIHRTFQEYLAAKVAIGERNLGLLVGHAADDQWQEVIVLASGHAAQELREQLIAQLLERGDQDLRIRHKVHLLAVACLETATQIGPDLQTALADRLEDLVPPRNMSEAHALASAGQLAVPLLTPVRAKLAAEAAASIRTLSLIGGPEALDAIARFGPDTRVTVGRELLRAWALFDFSMEYGARVLTDSILDYGTVTVHDIEQLSVLPSFSGLTHLFAHLDVDENTDLSPLTSIRAATNLILSAWGSVDLRGLRHANHITYLSLRDVDGPIDLEAVRGLTGLEGIDLRAHDEIVDGSPLADLPRLEHLFLDRTGLEDLFTLRGCPVSNLEVAWMPRLTSAAGAEHLPNLESLDLQSNPALADIDVIARCARLQTLNLSNCPPIARMPAAPASLVELKLGGGIVPADCRWLSTASDLEELRIKDSMTLRSLRGLERCRRIKVLSIKSCPELVDAGALAHLFDLERLTLDTPSEDLDLEMLYGLGRLRVVDLGGTRDANERLVDSLRARGIAVRFYPTINL
jgi:hypothetical protein